MLTRQLIQGSRPQHGGPCLGLAFVFGLFAVSGDLVSIQRRKVSLALFTLAVNLPEELVADAQLGIMSIMCSVEPLALVRSAVARAGYAVTLVGRTITLVGYMVTRLGALLPPCSILLAFHSRILRSVLAERLSVRDSNVHSDSSTDNAHQVNRWRTAFACVPGT